MAEKGLIIVLAWPETKVIHEGKWYDTPMRWLGILKNGYYTAGHSAIVLANFETNEYKYYDFGRYHTPAKTGRVRSYNTDPELVLSTKVEHENFKCLNIETLLSELQAKKACHGDGKLLASIYSNINLEKAYQKADFMQNLGIVPYGPLSFNGTNCSRFVNSITKASTKSWLKKLILTLPYTITASPKYNIRMINNQKQYYIMSKNTPQEQSNQPLLTQSVW